MNILNEIQIIPTRSSDISYSYRLLETYEISINGLEGEKNSYIKISANKYVNLDSDNYRIIFKKDLSQIYDVDALGTVPNALIHLIASRGDPCGLPNIERKLL